MPHRTALTARALRSAPAGAACRGTDYGVLRADGKTPPPACLDKVDRDVTCRLEQILIDEILHVAVRKDAVCCCRLIQSQGQGRTASPPLLHINTHSLRRILSLF